MKLDCFTPSLRIRADPCSVFLHSWDNFVTSQLSVKWQQYGAWWEGNACSSQSHETDPPIIQPYNCDMHKHVDGKGCTNTYHKEKAHMGREQQCNSDCTLIFQSIPWPSSEGYITVSETAIMLGCGLASATKRNIFRQNPLCKTFLPWNFPAIRCYPECIYECKNKAREAPTHIIVFSRFSHARRVTIFRIIARSKSSCEWEIVFIHT